MSKQDLSIIKENINFGAFLIDKGYIKQRKQIPNVEIYQSQGLKINDDVIFVTIVDGEQRYLSLALGDTGDIVEFVKNRIEFHIIHNTFTIGVSSLIDTAKVLLHYLKDNDSDIVKTDISDFTISEWQQFRRKIFSRFYNVEKLEDITYLENLKIDKKVFNSKIFKDRIYNSQGLIYNNENFNVTNLVFPITNSSGIEKGLYYINDFKPDTQRTNTLSFYSKYSNKELFWQSNVINKNAELTIVSSPIEAIAHYNYYREERNYLSLFQITRYSITELNKIITSFKGIDLSLSVSTTESLKEVEIICSLCLDKIAIKQVNDTDIIFEIETNRSKKSDDNIDSFIDFLKDKNSKIVRRLISGLGSSARPYKDDILFNIQTMDQFLYIYCPKNYINIYTICDALIKSFDFRKRVRIDKAKYHNWVKQNQEIPQGHKTTIKINEKNTRPVVVLRDKHASL